MKNVKWLDEETIADEMSDKDFQKKVDERAKTRKPDQSKDGMFPIWKKTYTHRGMKFDIIVLRYFTIGNPIDNPYKNLPLSKPMGTIKHKWVVLEHPEEMKGVVNFVEEHQTLLGRYDFLYADTLHSWNDGQTLKQRFEEMYKRGIDDIDWWLDQSQTTLNSAIMRIREEYHNINGVVVDGEK